MELPPFAVIFASTLGVFTTAMAERHGVAPWAVRRWAQDGKLMRVCGRAYVSAGTPITPLTRAIAIHLIWPDAVVCFLTAALLHGLNVEDDGVTHVLVPDSRRALPGTVLHRWSVRPTEVINDGLTVITDRRTTLADCLGRLPDDDAWGLLAWTYTRDQMTEEDLAAQIDDRHHLYGIVRLRVMLSAVRRRALSVGELHLQDFYGENGFTGWIGDYHLYRRGRVVARGDSGFEADRLIVDFDGKSAHNALTKARDARRDERIRAAGFDVLHVTWAILYERRRVLRDTIRAMLAAPPGSARRRDLAEALHDKDPQVIRRLLHRTVERAAS